MNSRISGFFSILQQRKLDAFLVTHPANITYLTEYQSRDSYLLALKPKSIYFTDSRYTAEAKIALKGNCVIKQANGSVFKLIAQTINGLGLTGVGFEERFMPYAEFEKISEFLSPGVKLIPQHSLVEELRQVKEPKEIKYIREAINITGKAIKFISKALKPGMSELEVVAELERYIRYQGASNTSFDIIVAFGPNCGYPHHLSSARKLKKDDPVMIDMGVEYHGYKCDLTRMFFLDKIKVLAKRIYRVVLEAQERAIKSIAPGKTASEIDAVSRNYIKDNGFGAYFGHNLGHGVGLEVHEAPYISPKSDLVLKPGMVFTVEPAIYLPQRVGIRIEDMVLVTKRGVEVLSGAINK